MSESALATDMLKTVSRLIGVLEREIEMLRAMKPRALLDLQEEKIVLTAAYEVQARALHERPAALDGIGPTLRDELRGAVAAFRRTLAENERALRSAKQTADQVLHAIAEEIQLKKQGPASYSAQNGSQSGSRGATEPVSLSLNQSV